MHTPIAERFDGFLAHASPAGNTREEHGVALINHALEVSELSLGHDRARLSSALELAGTHHVHRDSFGGREL